jgi:hypothetical protein
MRARAYICCAAAESWLLIGGKQVAGDGPALDVENPYTQTTLATVALPWPEQVDAAIGAARAAARGWGDTPAVERGELLHEVATRLRACSDELAELMTREGAKPLIENVDEVGWTAAAFDYYAEMGRNFAGRVIRARRRRRRPAVRALLRAGGRDRRARGDRPAARGDVRAGRATRDLEKRRALHAARSRPAPSGSTVRSPTTTPARSAAASNRASGASSARRAWGPSRRPSTYTSRRRSRRSRGGIPTAARVAAA